MRRKDACINGPLVCQKAEDLTEKNGKRQFCNNRKMVSTLEDKEEHLFHSNTSRAGGVNFNAVQMMMKTH
jgi:hypothetical protein